MATPGSSLSAAGLPDPVFWRGKRVLLTGHTGFKGGWLVLWLRALGAEVTGVALAPHTTPSLYEAAGIAGSCDSRLLDLRDAAALAALLRQVRPDVVLHLAAQALVREGYRAPLETFSTNVMGTANLLDAVRGCDSVRVALVVTTDKVYRNHEWHYPYRESDALGGHDPYSASKAAAELVTDCYRASFLIAPRAALASARAGNVIGGGDWSADRLLPDAVRAWQAGQALEIRRPQAQRPWQHVLEPLSGYLLLAQRLWHEPALAGAWNFGPWPHQAAPVREVITLAQTAWSGGDAAPVRWGDGEEGPHEAGLLALEIAKACRTLGWQPRWTLAESVGRTVRWYRAQAAGADAAALCLADIADYSRWPAGGGGGPAETFR